MGGKALYQTALYSDSYFLPQVFLGQGYGIGNFGFSFVKIVLQLLH